jgi:hypothetical protein
MVLTNPLEIVAFLQQHAKSRNLGESVVTNVVAGVLFLVSLVVLLGGASGGALLGVAVMAGVAIIVALLVGSLVLGWIYSVALGILGGKKSSLYEGFTTLTLSVYPVAFGFLIFSILTTIGVLTGNGIAILVLGALGGLAIAVTAVIGSATFYRATKDLFVVDYITAYIAGTIFGVAVLIALLPALGPFLTSVGLSGATGSGGLSPLLGLLGGA